MSTLFGDDAAVIELLRKPQHIGVIGVSRKPHRASYRVTQFLIDQGYQVSLINPTLSGSMLFDRPVFDSLAEASANNGRIDWVDVFRGVEHLPLILDQIIECGAGGIWGQLEIKDEAVARRAHEQGIRVVMDRCPAIELPRLQSQIN